MKIAIVGCGFASYLYGGTLCNHPSLEMVGVYDRRAERARLWCQRHGSQPFESFEELLASPAELIVNLTNPGAHFEVSLAALQAGKHVYSEKPLSTEIERAAELLRLAQDKSLVLACAPCSLMGEAAQTCWHALRSGSAGRIHTAYVALCVPPTTPSLLDPWVDSQQRGGLAAAAARALRIPVAWPYADEFDVGPVYEHAAYALKWLTSWFGPVRRVATHASCRAPHKQGWDHVSGRVVQVSTRTSDVYTSHLELQDDVEVIMTISTVMDLDLRLMLFGDNGCIELANQWDYSAPVRIRRPGVFVPDLRFTFPHPVPSRFTRQYPPSYGVNMDYCRGVAELASAIASRSASASMCSPEQELHVQEVTECIARGEPGWRTPRFAFQSRPQPRPLPAKVNAGVAGEIGATAQYAQQLLGVRTCELLAPDARSCAGPAADSSAGEVCRFAYRASGLVADPRVQLAINLTEPAERSRLTLSLLRARKHVFSASPCAETRESAEAIRALADSLGLHLECAPEPLISAPLYDLAERLACGCIGTVRSARAQLPIMSNTPTPTWGSLLAAQQEQLHQLIWLTSWILGPVWQVGPLQRVGHSETEGTVVFSSGATLHLTCHPRTDAADSFALQFFSDGNVARVLCSGADERIELATPIAECAPPTGPPGVVALTKMCDAICNGTLPRHSIDHALHQWRVLELMHAADATHRQAAAREPLALASWLVNA